MKEKDKANKRKLRINEERIYINIKLKDMKGNIQLIEIQVKMNDFFTIFTTLLSKVETYFEL